MHGFAGMRDGYRLARELVERFWDDGLYPSPGETDVERRCAHLLQLNGIDSTGALVPPIGRIPFTEVTSLGEFSRVQLQEAQALAKIADPKARQAKIDNGAISHETIQRAVAETRPEFYQVLFEDVALALEEFDRFNEAVRRKSGLDGDTNAYQYDPPSGNIREVVQGFLDIVKDLTKSKPKAKPTPAEPGRRRRRAPTAMRRARKPRPRRGTGRSAAGRMPWAHPGRRRVFPTDRAAVDHALRAGAGRALGQALAPRPPLGTDRGRSARARTSSSRWASSRRSRRRSRRARPGRPTRGPSPAGPPSPSEPSTSQGVDCSCHPRASMTS